MKKEKVLILKNICYTELVYDRINKKLNSKYTKDNIEKLLFYIIKETKESSFIKKGKNYYITNTKNNIVITINSNTFRVITVNLLHKN